MRRLGPLLLLIPAISLLTSCCSDPDLLIPNVESTSHQADANGEVVINVGETVTFNTDVANRPEDDCDDSEAVANLLGSIVQLFVNGTLAGTADHTYDTPALGYDQTHTQPNGVTFDVPGEYEFSQAADYTDLVSESNEENNWLVVFDFLEWIISLFGKDGTEPVKYRITVRDTAPADAQKQAHYEELIRTKKFVRFQ